MGGDLMHTDTAEEPSGVFAFTVPMLRSPRSGYDDFIPALPTRVAAVLHPALPQVYREYIAGRGLHPSTFQLNLSRF